MKMPCFTSVFADSIRRYIDFRQSCGCIYRQGAYELACFDRFAAASGLDSPLITAGLAGDFLAGMSQAIRKTRYNRMCVLRLFSAFHHLQWPETISAITSYLKLRSQTTAPPENARFLNNQKQRLTRFGVRDIIKRLARRTPYAAAMLACKVERPHLGVFLEGQASWPGGGCTQRAGRD